MIAKCFRVSFPCCGTTLPVVAILFLQLLVLQAVVNDYGPSSSRLLCDAATIKLAVFTTDGRYQRFGEDWMTVLNIWKDWVDSIGGINVAGDRHFIELHPFNAGDDTQKDLTKSISEQVANGTFGSFDFAISPYSSSLTPITATALHQYAPHMLLFSGGAASDPIFACTESLPYPCRSFGARRFPRLWSNLPSTSTYMGTSLVLSRLNGARTLAVYYDPSVFTSSICAAAVLEAGELGISVIRNVRLDRSNQTQDTADWMMRDIKDSDADLAILCSLNGFCGKINNATERLKLPPKGFIRSPCVTTDPYLMQPITWHSTIRGSDYSPNALSLAPFMYEPPGTVNTTAPERFDALFQSRSVNNRSASYQACNILQLALALQSAMIVANSTHPDDVNREMSNLNERSLVGPMAYDKFGRTITPMLTSQIDAGGTRRLIAPLKYATGDLLYPAPSFEFRDCESNNQCGSNGRCNAAGGCDCDSEWTGATCAQKKRSLSDGAIAGIVIAILVVIVVFIAIAVLTRAETRDVSMAPKDESKPFAILFTDIQASTTLWASIPELMGPAVDQHHSIIRELLSKHNVYEVKTIGDSFMCASSDIQSAARVALDIQKKFFNADFGSRAFDDIVRAKVEEDSGIILTDDDYSKVFSGIRVRVGVHFGEGKIQHDPVSLGYDYYGTVVNTAARIEGVSHGGQVAFSQAAIEALESGSSSLQSIFGYEVKKIDLGQQLLRGLHEPIGLVQILPTELSDRKFPPLRLDHAGDDGQDIEGSTMNGTGSPSVSRHSMSSASQSKQQASPDNFLFDMCQKEAEGIRGITADTLFFHAKFLQMCIAPIPLKKQFPVLEQIGKAWRVPLKRTETAAGIRRAVTTLATKIAQSVKKSVTDMEMRHQDTVQQFDPAEKPATAVTSEE